MVEVFCFVLFCFWLYIVFVLVLSDDMIKQKSYGYE